MNKTALLTTASLLNVLLMTFHLASDILFKMSPPGLLNLVAVFLLAGVLSGTLLLSGRRAGYVIVFLGSLLGLLMPILHMRGARGVLGGEIGNSGEAFFFVWTLLALGVTATFSLVLSVFCLWSSPRVKNQT